MITAAKDRCLATLKSFQTLDQFLCSWYVSDVKTLTTLLASMLTGAIKCNWAWENRSYLHIKFDLIVRV